MRAKRWVATGFDGPDDLEFVDHDVSMPGPGEVTIEVRAAGVNPADLKHVVRDPDPARLPIPLGYEVAGIVTALGPDTELASGGGAIGDEVLAFRVSGGYSTALTVPADKVFAKPSTLDFDAAAGLLLTGCTAADMLRVGVVERDETVVLHGASGAVGVAFLQFARLRGIRVIGTASAQNLDRVREFGGIAVTYGPDVVDRIRVAAAPFDIDAAFDAVGTDEAVDACLELVSDRSRIVTIAAPTRAHADGFVAIGGNQPDSLQFRDSVRANLIRLAGSGDLQVPIARTFALAQAPEALRLVVSGHAGGKVVLTG
ncbi:NADP-dependent oxidoreductase [Gordonia sp. ABSL1-1]|uniref:quinone oxidoreductase family protein n=1 Tax=Gordonia sp. ABSL1-1 TaxID=3053923 RepID=UPI00257235A7|nr:NADP-dependent oxidoreductase [Gordonia sp. ABSL1-1]MDL9935321.1 NADP-dependent oxidoreductase [Gordonia sp. ABSL1-1]